jgi:hypothetical protein
MDHIKIKSYDFVLKSFTTLPEVYQQFQKNLPIIGDFPVYVFILSLSTGPPTDDLEEEHIPFATYTLTTS